MHTGFFANKIHNRWLVKLFSIDSTEMMDVDKVTAIYLVQTRSCEKGVHKTHIYHQIHSHGF